MAIYPPPTFLEDIPIFNTINWEVSAENGITEAFLNANYLKYPVAQGFEALQEIAVNGNSTFNNPVFINDNITLEQTLPLKSFTWSDGTVQTTAPTGNAPSGVVAGSYTNTNLTVDTYGIITTASNGTASTNQLISSQLIPFTSDQIVFQTDITPPVGTRTLKIIICSAGCPQTPDSLSGNTMTAGTTGGGGSCSTLTIDMTAYQSTALTVPPLYWMNFLGAGVIGWNTAIFSVYGTSLPLVLNNSLYNYYWYVECQQQGGSNLNPLYTGGVVKIPPNQNANIAYSNGSNGVNTAPFDYTITTITTQYGRNILTETCADNATIALWTRGGYSTYSNGTTQAFTNGFGGVALYYYN